MAGALSGADGGEMAALQYPDLGSPPMGWTVGRQGAAIRLVPPGAYLDLSRAAMVVSPLVPIRDEMLAPDELILAALSAELVRTGARILEQRGPTEAVASSGLSGSRVEVTLRRADGLTERRAYVMYQDDRWLYGVHYIADAPVWGEFLPLFDKVAASVLPFSGP